MLKAMIIVAVDQPEEIDAFKNWKKKWKKHLTYMSPNEGCGCCVDIYRVKGTKEAVDSIPDICRSDATDWEESD